MVHHEPDLACTPCLGCDELIAPDELHKHSYHLWRSCCSWHPYHYWCIRPATRALAPMNRCGECGGELTADDIEDAIEFGSSFPARVHKGNPYAPPAPDRPASIRLVGWWRRTQIDTVAFPPRDGSSEPHLPALETGESWTPRQVGVDIVRRFFDIVHAECHDDDPHAWRAQLRAAPSDDDLREVYADYLEGSGDATRSEFVRTVLRRRRATGDRIAFLDRRLRELRWELPGSWCRDVARSV